MEDSEKTNDLAQGNGLSLIDVYSEDDSLLFKSPLRDPPDHHSSETQEQSNGTAVEDSKVTFEQTDQVPQLLESPEPERTIRKGKYNLRKSLAWDSAFFTNAGVLDPEELSCMIGGVEKGAKTLLPGIQENLQRSTESMSSLESDNLTLESLEADLFEDIRASTQKSSKLSKVANSSNKSRLGAAENQTIPSPKMDLPSQSKDMPKPTSKKPFVSKLGSGKTPKQPSVCPETPKRTATSGVATESGPKPPKVLGNGSPMSSLTPKRASLSSERTRKEIDNANGLTGRGTSVPKPSAISSSRSNAPRPVPIRSSKSSMLGSSVATKIDPRSSCSSISSSGSASSDDKSISSLNSIKRKVDLRTANVPSSSLTLKPLSRPKSNNTAGTSRLSAQLKSVTKASSIISPASSISDWSSESSSSTSTANQRSSNGRASLDSSKDVSIESDIPQVVSFGYNDLGAGSNSSRNGSQATGMLGRGIKKALTGTTSFPALGKPSGLRLPSPKIGFFDGAKSLVRTPNGSTQSSPSGGSHRVEAGRTSPSGNLSRAKMGKLQPARAVAVKGNTKHDTQQSASGTKLKSPPQEPSTASKKTSDDASRSTTNSPATSRNVQNKISLKTKGENHLKPKEIETKEPDTAVLSNPKVSLNMEDGIELKSCTPQELSLGSMKNNKASGSEDNDISLEPNGENHVEAKVVASVEPDIATHNLKFSLNVQDSNRNGSLEDPRIPLAVRDSFCNMDDSRDDTTGSTEVEEKTATVSLSFSEGNRGENS